MNRRTVLIAGFSAAVFAAAAPQVGLAQSSPLIGVWKLNLDKSKYSPGPPPKSQTLNFEGAGQDMKNTADTIDAQGQATKIVFIHIYDGKPPPNNRQSYIRRNHLHASRRLPRELDPFERRKSSPNRLQRRIH